MLPFPQEPMVPRAATSLPREDSLAGGAAYEPKFDGYRALMFVDAGECRIQSRSGRDITAAFPDVASAAVTSLPSGVVIDGELMLWGDESADFVELQRRLSTAGATRSFHGRPASYLAFDILAGAGMDLRSSPFRVRRQALTILLGDAEPPMHVVPQTRDREEAQGWLASYAEAQVGVEGVVVKGLGTPYNDLGDAWWKLRLHDSFECLVVGVVGSTERPEALVLGRPTYAGGLHLVGVTSPLSDEERRRLGTRLAIALSTEAPQDLTAVPADDRARARFLVPSLVVEVETPSDEETTTMTFSRIRPDMDLGEVAAGP